jgi:hypothetical protein
MSIGPDQLKVYTSNLNGEDRTLRKPLGHAGGAAELALAHRQ